MNRPSDAGRKTHAVLFLSSLMQCVRVGEYIYTRHIAVSTWMQISSVCLFCPESRPLREDPLPQRRHAAVLFSLLSFSSQDQSRLYSRRSFDVESIPDAACGGKTVQTRTCTCAGLAAVVTGPETGAGESLCRLGRRPGTTKESG